MAELNTSELTIESPQKLLGSLSSSSKDCKTGDIPQTTTDMDLPISSPLTSLPSSSSSSPPRMKAALETTFHEADYRRYSGRQRQPPTRFGTDGSPAVIPTPSAPKRKRTLDSAPSGAKASPIGGPKIKRLKSAQRSATRKVAEDGIATPSPTAKPTKRVKRRSGVYYNGSRKRRRTSAASAYIPSSSSEPSPAPSWLAEELESSASSLKYEGLPDLLSGLSDTSKESLAESGSWLSQYPKYRLPSMQFTTDTTTELFGVVHSQVPLDVAAEAPTTLDSPAISTDEHAVPCGPPPLDQSTYDKLVTISKHIMGKTPLESKPEPRGVPEVWAPTRQALCETILYFQSWQSASYISKGVLYSFMFDGNGHSRDLIDGDVVIARAGGGMGRDKITGEMQQNKSQTENNQTQAVRAAIASQNPIVILCGSENTDVPTRMPHRYQVLGWFKPTHVWAERSESRGKVWVNYKYRFEKLRTGLGSWWLPTSAQECVKNPQDGETPLQTPTLPSESSSGDDQLVEDSGPVVDGSLSSKDASMVVVRDGTSPEVSQTVDSGAIDQGLSGQPKDHSMRSDTSSSPPWSHQAVVSLREYGSRTPERPDNIVKHERKDSAHSNLDSTQADEIVVGCFDSPVIFVCRICEQPSEQVYLTSWMCLHPECQEFFRLSSGGVPDETSLHYDPRFIKQKTPWISEAPPSSLRPALPDPSAQLGESVSFAMTRGMCCPQCGKCTSRSRWAGWFCECGFSHTPPHAVIPATRLRDPWHPVSNLYAQCHDWADSCLITSVQFSHNYRIVTYKIPGLDGCSISHLIANKTVNEEPQGPDDMFHALQELDCGLERRRFVTGKEEFMTAFSNNRGMPYKFVAKGESLPFSGSPWPLTATRSRLNWASRLVLGDQFGQPHGFNELLTIGYFDGQNIKYHDDGEKGLGPTVASLSLGFPADMLFRVKSKHWTGMTKGGQFVHKRPLRGTSQYSSRLSAWEKLGSQVGDATPKPDQLKRVATALGLQDNVKDRKPWLRLRLSHGDVVVMHGAPLQEYLEHQVDPLGTLRFALTCRTILPGHLSAEEMPEYEVGPDEGGYDGVGIKEMR